MIVLVERLRVFVRHRDLRTDDFRLKSRSAALSANFMRPNTLYYAPEIMQPELCVRIKPGTLRMIGGSRLFLKNSFSRPFIVESFVEIG